MSMKRMTYEQKADVYLRAFEQTGSVALALQAADREMFSAQNPRRRMTDERLADLRARRANGATLSELSEAFLITENYACVLCRGVVRKAIVKVQPPSLLGLAIVRIVGALPPGWERIHRRGKPGSALGRAQRAATLAMRAQGLTFQEIGIVLGRDPSTVIKNLPHAKEDAAAQQLASVVAEILARDAAPIALPEPAAQHRAA
jgi:hypothetical protein